MMKKKKKIIYKSVQNPPFCLQWSVFSMLTLLLKISHLNSISNLIDLNSSSSS